ncbi:MAG: hypothetical protein ACLGIC_12625 [Acidimicrobiia bacterium]
MLGAKGRVTLAAAAAVVAGGAWLAVGSGDGGDDLRAGSELVDADASQLLAPEDPPDAYRIDYRIEGYGGGDRVVTADRLWVRRPFDSRLEVFPGPDPTGDPDAVQVGAFGAFRAEGEARDPVVVASPPGPPPSDVRIASALAAAVEDGRAEVVEHRRVLGRTCAVVRTAVPFASGDLRAAGDDGERTDTCVDAQGLVLEELVVSDGEPLLRRLATEVDLDPDLDDVSFDAGEPTLEVDQGGGFVGELAEGSRSPGRFFEAEGPAGFERRGRYAVVPPQAESFTDPTKRGERLTYVSDVWVDGVDVVVLDQGGTFGDVDPFPGLEGVDVDLELGPATLTYDRTGAAVVVYLGEGDFLRARGTVTPDVLVELLRGLREVEGGELRALDPAD